jgi:hypothetical protein
VRIEAPESKKKVKEKINACNYTPQHWFDQKMIIIIIILSWSHQHQSCVMTGGATKMIDMQNVLM